MDAYDTLLFFKVSAASLEIILYHLNVALKQQTKKQMTIVMVQMENCTLSGSLVMKPTCLFSYTEGDSV